MRTRPVQLHTPLGEEVLALKAGDHVELSGIVYTARDEAHLRMREDRMRSNDQATGEAPLVLKRSEGGVVTLTLNRGQRYNPLSSEMIAALEGELDRVAKDETARVVVLAGAGKGFSAGHDLKEMRAHSSDEAWQKKLFADCNRMMVKLTRIPQPVIARVHGVATAAGCQLVAMCDLAGRVLVEAGEFHMLTIRDRSRLAAPLARPELVASGLMPESFARPDSFEVVRSFFSRIDEQAPPGRPPDWSVRPLHLAYHAGKDCTRMGKLQTALRRGVVSWRYRIPVYGMTGRPSARLNLSPRPGLPRLPEPPRPRGGR